NSRNRSSWRTAAAPLAGSRVSWSTGSSSASPSAAENKDDLIHSARRVGGGESTSHNTSNPRRKLEMKNLIWPVGWPRTPPGQKQSADRFKHHDPSGQRIELTPRQAEALLRDELRKFDASRVLITSDGDAVAIYFVRNGQALTMASDRYDGV